MTDKELNSHNLAREIEIVKLQEENEELKSQLRGTTHCFDEEEHKKLKEEITNLSKDVDMWNKKYNDMFDENKRLKEALETKLYCKYANKCNEIYDCSREEYEDMANANMRLHVENQELKKQLENCYCNRTDCSGRIKDSKKYDSLVQKVETQQKEFINYLQKEINQYASHIEAIDSVCTSIYSSDYDNSKIKLAIYKGILQKYKKMIGENDV